MLLNKKIPTVISHIKVNGVDQFLKENAIPSQSAIDGVDHYVSLIEEFEKFILFSLGKNKEISLIFSDKNIKASDILESFVVKKIAYNFREDISKLEIEDDAYFLIDGKIDLTRLPATSTDARGNTKNIEDIDVSAIIVEIN